MGDVGGCKLSYRPANRLLAEDRERPPVKGSHKIARVTFLLYHPPVFPPTLSIYLSSYTSTYYDTTVCASFLAKLVQSCEYTYLYAAILATTTSYYILPRVTQR